MSQRVPGDRRVLIRVWTVSLCGAAVLLVALAWMGSSDPNLAGRAQALRDGEALLGALDLRTESWLRELRSEDQTGAPASLGELSLGGGRVWGPRPLPEGNPLVDAPAPQLTPAQGWYRSAARQRADPEAALESLEQGLAAVGEAEPLTELRLRLEAALMAQRLDRDEEALAYLSSFEMDGLGLLDGNSSILTWVHRRLDLMEELGWDEKRATSAAMHFDALLQSRYPVQPEDFWLEAELLSSPEVVEERTPEIVGILRATLADRVWAERPEAAVVALGEVQPRHRGGDGREEVAVLAADGRQAQVYTVDDLSAALMDAWSQLLPPGGAFAVAESAESAEGELVGVLGSVPGLKLAAQLRVVDFGAFTSAQVKRRGLLLGAAAVLAAALVALAWFGRRLLLRQAELERVRAEFLSGVSHELRTPAASLVLLAENLADGRVSDEKRRAEYYEALRRDAQRLQRLVGDVLDVSRMERGSFEIHPELLAPGPLIEGIAEDQRARLMDVGLELRLEIPDELPEVPLDGGALERGLANLLENARKYAAEGKTVTVRVSHSSDELRIDVEDDGPGVPIEWRERVFERYQRAPSSETLAAGAGLGLALVRETVMAHGGSVHVDDSDAGGARFTLRFPMSEAPNAEQE